MLVLDVAEGAVTGARSRAVRVAAVRATELNHEAVDDPVEVKPIVETGLGQLDEVPSRFRHHVGEKLDFDITERSLQSCGRIRHGHGLPALSRRANP